jgi:hypothetical protein
MWMYASIGGMVAFGVSDAIRFYAYEVSYSAKEDGNSSAYPDSIRAEMVELLAGESAMALALWMESGNWWYAQMEMLDEETRMSYEGQKEEMLAMFGL